MDIYEYSHYRQLFKDCFDNHPKKGKGLRKEFATFIRCQPAYISRVFSGKFHFSQEQAVAACRFFKFSDEKTDFAMLLLNFERSGNKELKLYYKKKIDEQKIKSLTVKNALGDHDVLLPHQSIVYYSEWFYPAIHMLVEVRGMTSIEKMANTLRLHQSVVKQAIDFLCKAGIIALEKGRYKVQKKYLHIDNNCPEISQYHRNLRLKAIETFPVRDDESLYFSSFLTCEKEDLAEIKKKLLGTIRKCSSVIKESKPGLAAGLNIDLYKI